MLKEIEVRVRWNMCTGTKLGLCSGSAGDEKDFFFSAAIALAVI